MCWAQLDFADKKAALVLEVWQTFVAAASRGPPQLNYEGPQAAPLRHWSKNASAVFELLTVQHRFESFEKADKSNFWISPS